MTCPTPTPLASSRPEPTPRVVQERLGHANAASTMQVYGHVSPGMQAEAADAFATLMQGDG